MNLTSKNWYKVFNKDYSKFCIELVKQVNDEFHLSIDTLSINQLDNERLIDKFNTIKSDTPLYIKYNIQSEDHANDVKEASIRLSYRSNYNPVYMAKEPIDYRPTNIVGQPTKLLVVDDDIIDNWLDKDTQKYLNKRRDDLLDSISYSMLSRFNKENKGDITNMLKLVNKYYDNKVQTIQKECEKEKELVLTNNLVYNKAKEFTDFINQFNAAQNCISNLKPHDFINAYNYLTISERKDLQTIDDTTTAAIKDVETERDTVLALLSSTETFEQKLDILNRYNILILPKKINRRSLWNKKTFSNQKQS